jgi:hypothetical protein
VPAVADSQDERQSWHAGVDRVHQDVFTSARGTGAVHHEVSVVQYTLLDKLDWVTWASRTIVAAAVSTAYTMSRMP